MQITVLEQIKPYQKKQQDRINSTPDSGCYIKMRPYHTVILTLEIGC